MLKRPGWPSLKRIQPKEEKAHSSVLHVRKRWQFESTKYFFFLLVTNYCFELWYQNCSMRKIKGANIVMGPVTDESKEKRVPSDTT